jgi:hypothetical protein
MVNSIYNIGAKMIQPSQQNNQNTSPTEILEHVHTYVWGPTQVSSLGVSRYYVNFIDDANRKTWVYCIRQKSDVLTLLRNGKIWLRMRQEKF